MNEQNPNLVGDLLGVASGNRDLKVGFYTNEIIYIGVVIMVAVFLGSLFAKLVAKGA